MEYRMTTFLLLLMLLGACTFQDEPGVCPFNVRLEYRYAGYAYENRLPVRVDNLREYLYDGSGKLIQTKELRGDSITGYQTTLAPGDYTLVVWGNVGNKAASSMVATDDNQWRNSRLVNSPAALKNDLYANNERLYYGTAAFQVTSTGVLRQRIYVTHAHANLKVTVSWRIQHPEWEGLLRMRLCDVPGEYGFWTGQEISAPNGAGPYTIPYIGESLVNYETRAAVDYNDDVIGEFITHRFCSDSHPLWSLYCNGKQVVRELDLQRYFNKSAIDLDHNVEQEFHLLIMVEDQGIVITEISSADWDEGGALG